jgi:hypothetical protein
MVHSRHMSLLRSYSRGGARLRVRQRSFETSSNFFTALQTNVTTTPSRFIQACDCRNCLSRIARRSTRLRGVK